MSESWIVGINPVEGALANDASRVRELLVDIATAQRNARIKELVDQARAHHIPVHHRPREQLDKLAGQARHQGIVALYEPPPMTHEDQLAGLIGRDGLETLVLVLDGVTDPHNLGACLRSAAPAGACPRRPPGILHCYLNQLLGVRQIEGHSIDRHASLLGNTH